jgi:hypothetical protein
MTDSTWANKITMILKCLWWKMSSGKFLFCDAGKVSENMMNTCGQINDCTNYLSN